VVALETAGELEVDPHRLLSPEAPSDTLRAFDGELSGKGLAFGAGKARDSWVHGWSDPGASVRWPVRVTTAASYDVFVSYDADGSSAGGTFRVRLGSHELSGTVQRTPGVPVGVGRVTLEPGVFDLAVEPIHIAGSELMRLRALILRPTR
jgi:hypothetical protein